MKTYLNYYVEVLKSQSLRQIVKVNFTQSSYFRGRQIKFEVEKLVFWKSKINL